MANSPFLVKPIPAQIVNEGAAFGPLDLNSYIQSDSESGPIRFMGELLTGAPLPQGLICTQSGVVSGIPGPKTAGMYEILAVAENASGIAFTSQFTLTIKERIAIETNAAKDYLSDLKSRVWEAVGKNLPIPDLADLLERPITAVEIYYLLQRFATLTIWDVYNLETPGDKKSLNLAGASEHYHIFDRGSCLVGTPKSLFSYDRTLEDALQTARAMAREVYDRGWVIEFAGFEKMARGAWIELQHLTDKHGKEIEILHYTPTEEDKRIYSAQTKTMGYRAQS